MPYPWSAGEVLTASDLNSAIAGAGSPGGSDGYIQYNDGGSFGGSSLLTFNDATGALSATSFSGDGGGLYNLNASQLAIGTVPSARISGIYSGITAVGLLSGLSTTGIVYAAGLDSTGVIKGPGPDGGSVMRYWTASTSYSMIGTANMTGQEYSLLFDGTSTYIGAGTGGAVYLRGPANDTNPQLVNDGVRLTAEGTFYCTSAIYIRYGQTGEFNITGGSGVPGNLAYISASGLDTPVYVGTSMASSTNSDYYSFSDSAYGGYGGQYHFKADTSVSATQVGNAAVTAGRFFASNTSVGSTSDARLKSDIDDLDQGVALAIINRLRPRTFVWDKEDWTGLQPTGTQIGFIAQEVDEVFPAWVDYWPEEQVIRASDGEVIEKPLAFGLDYQFDAMVVAAIQNIVSRLEALEQA